MTRSRIASLIRWTVGVTVGIITFYLALRTVSLTELANAFTRAHWLIVGLALVSVAVNTGAKAARWKLLVGLPGKAIPWRKYCAALLAGQALNTVYPARLGELARAYMLGGLGAGRSYVVGTLVLEKLVDVLCYACLFFVLLLMAPLPDWLNHSAYVMLVSTAVFALGFVAAYVGRGRLWQFIESVVLRLPQWAHFPLLKRLQAALRGVTSLRSWREWAVLIVWSVLIWATAVSNNQLILWAMGIDLPLGASVLILVVLQAGISLPAAPGKVGVFELACMVALAAFDVPGSTAFGYGVLLHAVVLLPSTFLGLWFVWPLGWRAGNDAASR